MLDQNGSVQCSTLTSRPLRCIFAPWNSRNLQGQLGHYSASIEPSFVACLVESNQESGVNVVCVVGGGEFTQIFR